MQQTLQQTLLANQLLVFNPEETNVLEKWKRIEPDFPCMAALARDILTCAGAGVSVERLFSIAQQQASFNQDFALETFKAQMLILKSCYNTLITFLLLTGDQILKQPSIVPF